MSTLSKARPQQNSLFRSWQGPLTRELVQAPSAHGLGRLPERLQPTATTESVCGFCSTGCSLKVHLRDGEAINLSADPQYPVNRGMACPKGWEALAPLSAGDRATEPLLRGDDGRMRSVKWNGALSVMVDRFRRIQECHGPDSLAWLGTGQIPTEELALLGSVAKFGLGIRHGDGNTRQCMATAVTAYKESFGFDAPPYTYEDFEESDVLVFFGSNLCIAHPILWQRVLRNRRNPDILVVDPRATETAQAATRHYALQPKSDLSLVYGLAHLLLKKDWLDHSFIRKHTNGFDAFAEFVQSFHPERVSAETGLSVQQLEQFAERIGRGGRVSFWWTMGVNQSHEGVRVAQGIINLALMTGNIGKPGTGANSITGQCNAMGSRLFSNTTGLLGGRDFENPQHRNEVASILNIPEERIPDQKSLAYDQIIEGIQEGRIKGLWIVATNSAHSWMHQNGLMDALRQLEFLVVQDMYASTETAQLADLLLPAAGWGEKEGTFINSERRFGRVRKVRRAPGEALSDFSIFQLIAHYAGCADLFRDWDSPEAVFEILKKLSRGQPCDITGIEGYSALEKQGGIQWPCSEQMVSDMDGQVAAQRRLFEDGRFYHADGRARFIFEQPRELPEACNVDYPFTLLTGRGTSAQWHTQTRTSKSGVLRKLYPQNNYVELHPEDARMLELEPGETVQVRSRRGRVRAVVHVTPIVQPRQVFMPMHYPEVNRLTFPVVDPYSRQPGYKACAVCIEKTSKKDLS